MRAPAEAEWPRRYSTAAVAPPPAAALGPIPQPPTPPGPTAPAPAACAWHALFFFKLPPLTPVPASARLPRREASEGIAAVLLQ